MKTQLKIVYIFYRKEGWYPVEYYNDQQAIDGALLNEGTLKVERASGKLVWRKKDD